MRIIRAAECRRMPWKNGGGETIEIAVSPAGASVDDFDWRVSMAHVETPGPFSNFPCVDRTLAVIEGKGIVLHLAGRGAAPLTREAAPFAFPGDLPVDATLIDGAIDDLNVMTRRGRYRHLLSRMHLDAPIVLPRHGGTVIVLIQSGGATVRAGARSETVGRRDAVVSDDADVITLDGSADLLVIDLWRC